MKIKIIQAPDQEVVASEVIAQSIKKMADGFDRMKGSGLSDRAIVALIQDASGLSKREINSLLYALENLKKLYLKKTDKK